MDFVPCQHRFLKIIHVFQDGKDPVGFVECAQCGKRMEDIEISYVNSALKNRVQFISPTNGEAPMEKWRPSSDWQRPQN